MSVTADGTLSNDYSEEYRVLTANDDLDNILETGIYSVMSAKPHKIPNIPEVQGTSPWAMVKVTNMRKMNIVLQEYWNMNGGLLGVYTRRKYNGVFSKWTAFMYDANTKIEPTE